MEENLSQETVNDHILAAAKLVAIEMFAGLDISKPVTLSSGELFSVINNLLKENYGYTISNFTYMFTVIKTMRNVAGEYGVDLILT